MEKFSGTNDIYEAIVEILAVTVLLDHKKRDQELLEFTHSAMVINQILHDEKIVTREALLNWFNKVCDEIESLLYSESAETYKKGLLKKITDKSLQRHVLSAIFAISVCDYELHDEENDFIKLALELWGATLPTPDCVDVLA